MTPQVQQVFGTYLNRRWLWALAGFGLISFGPSVAIVLTGEQFNKLPPALTSIAIALPTAIAAYVLASQAKWQFCDSRARMIPRFGGPHVVVLAALAVIAFGVFPAALSLAGHWSTLGVPACTIVIATASIWMIHSGRWLGGVIAFGAYLSLMTEPGLRFWVDPEQGQQLIVVHAALFIAGWAGFSLWLRRLMLIREEDADYFVPIQAQFGSASRMERTNATRVVARSQARNRWTTRINDAWHDRLAGIRATTPAARQRLLRYGFAVAPPWMSALPMAGSFFVMFLFMERTGVLKAGGPTQSILPALNIVMIMPTLMTAGLLAMRRARMSQELLLPMSRRQYINGLLQALARNSAWAWVAAHVALIGLIAATSPNLLTLVFLVQLAALSLAAQLLAFGSLAWSAIFTSAGKRLSLMMMAVVLVSVPVFVGMAMLGDVATSREEAVADALAAAKIRADYPPELREQLEASTRESAIAQWDRRRPSPLGLWSTVGGTAVVGLALTAYARRRWLEQELA